MNEQISVHDNILLGYDVDSQRKRIVFRTEYPHTEEKQKTDVIFEDVKAYHFEGDLFSTIIFDIEEIEPATAMKQIPEVFERRAKHGWPQGWEKKKESFEEFASRLDLKAYWIQSSYGLDGFVLAKSMKKTSANQALQTTSASARCLS